MRARNLSLSATPSAPPPAGAHLTGWVLGVGGAARGGRIPPSRTLRAAIGRGRRSGSPPRAARPAPRPRPAPAQPAREYDRRCHRTLAATCPRRQLRSGGQGHGGVPGPDHVAVAPLEPALPLLRPSYGRPRRPNVRSAARGTRGRVRSGQPAVGGGDRRAPSTESGTLRRLDEWRRPLGVGPGAGRGGTPASCWGCHTRDLRGAGRGWAPGSVQRSNFGERVALRPGGPGTESPVRASVVAPPSSPANCLLSPSSTIGGREWPGPGASAAAGSVPTQEAALGAGPGPMWQPPCARGRRGRRRAKPLDQRGWLVSPLPHEARGAQTAGMEAGQWTWDAHPGKRSLPKLFPLWSLGDLAAWREAGFHTRFVFICPSWASVSLSVTPCMSWGCSF